MQIHARPQHRSGRMIAALAAFVALAAGLVLGSYRARLSPNALPVPMAKQPTFYKAIGRTPADFEENEAPLPAAARERYTLELSVGENRAAAENYVEKLSAQGVEAFYTPLQHGSRVVYRVRHGVFASATLAAAAALDLKAQKNLSANVVKLQ